MLSTLSTTKGVIAAGLFIPGQPFTVKAKPGERFVFASMFVQSNDKFYAPNPAGIALFDGRNPIAGDLTSKVELWDAGTEKDEPPGIGEHQAPRQASANSGPDEAGTIRPADDGFTYPAVPEVIQVTVLAQSGKTSMSGS